MSVFALSGGQLRRVIKCRSVLVAGDRLEDVVLCVHISGGWMVCLGTAVCSLSKTVGTAFIPIHHLRRDDLAFRGAGRLSALLMRF